MFIELFTMILLDIKIFSIYFVFNSQYIFRTSLPSIIYSCIKPEKSLVLIDLINGLMKCEGLNFYIFLLVVKCSLLQKHWMGK